MRDILFRGKCVDNGEWVYGCFSHFFPYTCPLHDLDSLIIDGNPEAPYKVIPDSVGQYTGLKDKDGTKIFEGDIVKYKNGYIGVVKYGSFYPSEYAGYPYNMYCQKIFGLYLESKDKQFVIPEKPKIQVIGNIYDNPELLGESK